jgi:hypothetical protein
VPRGFDHREWRQLRCTMSTSLRNTMIALGVVDALVVYGGESAPMGRSGSRMA